MQEPHDVFECNKGIMGERVSSTCYLAILLLFGLLNTHLYLGTWRRYTDLFSSSTHIAVLQYLNPHWLILNGNGVRCGDLGEGSGDDSR